MTVDVRFSARTHFARLALLPVLLALSSCSRDEEAGPGNDLSTVTAAEELLEAAEENAAALARDEELANEAAADEAEDMNAFGGNAAAGETGNLL